MSDPRPAAPLEPAPDLRLVLSTAPPDVAERLATAWVEAGLAACVNLVTGVRSVYRWEGGVQNDPETLLLAKTRADRVEDLVAALRAAHPYDVPEVLIWAPEAGAPDYLAWVRSCAGADGDAEGGR